MEAYIVDTDGALDLSIQYTYGVTGLTGRITRSVGQLTNDPLGTKALPSGNTSGLA
jgi:hypothetical protein